MPGRSKYQVRAGVRAQSERPAGSMTAREFLKQLSGAMKRKGIETGGEQLKRQWRSQKKGGSDV